MKVVLVAPTVYSLGKIKYGGIERLCKLLGAGMASRGHQVSVVGGRGTGEAVVPGCLVYEGSRVGDFELSEAQAFAENSWLLQYNDVILDLSHSHIWRRAQKAVPGMSWLWHDPFIMEPPMPYSNVCSLSGWQGTRFMQKTGRLARVVDIICADTKEFYYDPLVKPGNCFLAIGAMLPQKGNLEAVRLCREAGVELNIIGPASDREYTKAVEAECGEGINYLGEVSEDIKMSLLRKARGLVYPVAYEEGFGEAHSHKLVEALMCGVPCIVRDQGAMHECFSHLADIMAPDLLDGGDLLTLMRVGYWDRGYVSTIASREWSVDAVLDNLEPLLERAWMGERW